MGLVNISFGMNLVFADFIAVNYLIYTNEVIGNIMSLILYSIVFSFVCMLGSLRISLSKKQKIYKTFLLIQKIKISGIYLLLLVLHLLCLIFRRKLEIVYLPRATKPAFINFILLSCTAELDYFKFYKTIQLKHFLS
jgi:hypothetical protein